MLYKWGYTSYCFYFGFPAEHKERHEKMLTNLSLKIKTQTNIRSPTQGPMHFAKNDYVQVNATEVNLHHKFAF